MSLNAYNGMITKKGFNHIHSSLVENLDKFKKESQIKLFKTYGELFTKHLDGYTTIHSSMVFQTQTKNDTNEINDIKKEDVPLFSYIFQCGKILSKSYFVNDFTVHLPITIEPIKNKILVYPNILVDGHREILLTFLDDWYCQDSTDPDENVKKSEWKKRKNDWYSFNEITGLESKIILFNPQTFDNLVERTRGEELLNGIFDYLPTMEKRKNIIWKNKFLSVIIKEKDFESYYNATNFMITQEGEDAFSEYKEKNPIDLVEIDKELILNYKI